MTRAAGENTLTPSLEAKAERGSVGQTIRTNSTTLKRVLDGVRWFVTGAAARLRGSKRDPAAVPDQSADGPTNAEAVQYPGVFGRVHRCDLMIGGTNQELIDHYKRVGEQAYALSAEAVALAGNRIEDSRAVLDFGSGYGRVTRVLAQKLRPGTVSAFDVDNGAGVFCGREFGVEAVPFDGNWDHVPWHSYDVIWVGSVFTHLSERETRRVLSLVYSITAPGGVLVFTTHGEEALIRLGRGDYGPRFQEYKARVELEFTETGFSFLPFVQQEVDILPAVHEITDYGMTWMTAPYVEKLMQDISGGNLDLLKFTPRGWDHHQDVWMYHKR